MLRKPPKHCQGFVDRHGRPRWYYRRPGYPRVALPGLPWSPEFMAAYEKASAGEPAQVGAKRTIPGTINALVASYYRSREFLSLRPITQSTYRNVIERFREKHGDKRAARMERGHIKSILAKLSDRPEAASQLLKIIKVLVRHGLDAELVTTDPTIGIRKVKSTTGGFQSWSEEHIAQFQNAHAIGTRARLALDLLLFTGQRRGDVVCMGRQHVRAGVLTITQSKTGTLVEIPLHADLKRSLDALPKDSLTFLMTAQGKPFTAPGFTNHFRDLCTAAGLPAGLSPHGLRKAACRRLAEAGCTAPQLMAISGHRTLSEAQKYIEAANRAKLAKEGMGKVTRMTRAAEKRTNAVKPAPKV